MIYFCKDCGTLDELGIAGHHTRCRMKQRVVANKPEVVANKSRSGDRHKDKEARLTYMRELMRKRRAVS